jgi:hypothetical protein
MTAHGYGPSPARLRRGPGGLLVTPSGDGRTSLTWTEVDRVIDCTDPDRMARLRREGATITFPVPNDGLDHYAVGMRDPEGNAFDVN